MNKQKAFGLNWPGRFESMERTLLMGEDDAYDRGEILEFIQQFAEGSYWIGSDPIPHLQRVFPSIDWEYYELPDTDAETQAAMFEEMVKTADFFWPVAGPANFADWLLAKKRGEQKRLSLCGCEELIEDIKDSKTKNFSRIGDEMQKSPSWARFFWSIYSTKLAVFGKVINGRPDL